MYEFFFCGGFGQPFGGISPATLSSRGFKVAGHIIIQADIIFQKVGLNYFNAVAVGRRADSKSPAWRERFSPRVADFDNFKSDWRGESEQLCASGEIG